MRPLYSLTSIPERVQNWSEQRLESDEDLQREIQRLRQESLIHRGQLQRMAELSAENVRLRQLLNATELLMESVLISEVIGVSPNPQQHILTINRGSDDGVTIGQPVLDAEGLMGQVIDVHGGFSSVLLITDSSHALPVQLLRTGARSIAEGTADYNRLRLRFVSATADIEVGDKLVSSGLGGRFPAGYPVGEVISIDQKPGEAYLSVEVQPLAKLDRSRHLLLLFRSSEGAATRTGK